MLRMMPMTLKRLAAAAGLAVSSLACATAASAQQFDVPDGFVVSRDTEMAPTDEWRPILKVAPSEGPFSNLSAIHLREVPGAVSDADAWLRQRVTVSLEGLDEGADMLAGPDSPFGDPVFDSLRKALPELFGALGKLAKAPLEFCDDPRAGYNAAGELRELYCVFNLGPIRHYRLFRLQQAGKRWFYTEIRTMNERRLRHLTAIANSFKVTK